MKRKSIAIPTLVPVKAPTNKENNLGKIISYISKAVEAGTWRNGVI